MAATKEQKHASYLRNKERILKRNKQWEEDNPIAFKYSRYKQAARHRNLEFNLSKIEFAQLISQPCYYCGELQVGFNGVDRIDNNIGYHIKNCVPCCKLCNKMKTNIDVSSFIIKCNDIKEKQMVIS